MAITKSQVKSLCKVHNYIALNGAIINNDHTLLQNNIINKFVDFLAIGHYSKDKSYIILTDFGLYIINRHIKLSQRKVKLQLLSSIAKGSHSVV